MTAETTQMNDALEAARTSYDIVPYPSHPFRQTHPERLHALGRLFGMTPADIRKCRVLEIGCAGGGNIIPMAEVLPESEFVGFDLSQRQVEVAKASIEKIGLTNIEVKHLDIMDVDESLGKFDYIICHGVYSWVPAEVRSKILQICRDQLNPQGIALVSYNTLPGWHLRGAIRNMMSYHTRVLTDPKKKVQQARALLEFLAKSVGAETGAYGKMINSELELLKKQTDNYLYHDHLEAENTQFYFHEFIEEANKHDLQYLAEAHLATMWTGNFPKEVAETLERVAPDIIQREQYADFVRNRTFRQTLLCAKGTKIDRALGEKAMDGSWISSPMRPSEKSPDAKLPPNSVSFRNTQTNQGINTSDPLMAAAIEFIGSSFPLAVSFDDMVAHVEAKAREMGDVDPTALRRGMANNMIHMMVGGLIDVSYNSSLFTKEVTVKPKVPGVARIQAASTDRLTNARHETIRLDDLTRHIAILIDGEKTHHEIRDGLKVMLQDGTLTMRKDGEAMSAPQGDVMERIAAEAVAKALVRLSQAALLIQ
ncbi:methyltransferase regulatory domain-containing protein [Blastopirellula retiformator]|uniref:tRNA (Guanine-N(7)-)-methyltransferase n=1 Tax=Blastopirellula retiformator TaxID=2527970 RepID=A0A5C5VNA3_9BACT|nr:class I SAM-dependent methyltransferase [Blastopirellula retiformator]TWT39385.1 tRNA (guanine-N(7)-)-methyltransferase [Blastopirellula retiformator]